MPVQMSCCSTASAMGITMAVVDVLLSHMERNTVQHMKPNTSLQHKNTCSSQSRLQLHVCVCVTPAEYIHARLGPGDHDHPQSDAFMQVPLLNGGGQTDHPHQQQRGVLKILRGHLQTHTHTQFLLTTFWTFLKSYINVRTKHVLLVMFMEHSYNFFFFYLFLFWTTTLHEIQCYNLEHSYNFNNIWYTFSKIKIFKTSLWCHLDLMNIQRNVFGTFK